MKSILFTLTCLCFQFITAQPYNLFLKAKKEKYDGPQWTQKNKASIDLSQVSFTNWNSGGVNSISGLLGLESYLRCLVSNRFMYSKKKLLVTSANKFTLKIYYFMVTYR